MDSGKFILGLLAGFAVGALAGILLAPAKGEETRKQLALKGEEWLDELKGKMDSIIQEMAATANEAAEKANQAAARAEEAAEKR